MSPRLLALDTSTSALSVAVHDGVCTHSANEPGGPMASSRLLPLVHKLLAAGGLSMRELDGIAFGQGPGAFTGLRTSCAVAQGLAFGLGCPVLALSSLMIVAEDARAQIGNEGAVEVAVAMDARIEQLYAGRFRFDGSAWAIVEPAALLDLPELLARWSPMPPAVVAGSAWEAFGERLLLPGCRRVPREADRAAALMRLALQRWCPEATVDAANALPLYLRDKVALTTQERDAARLTRAPTSAAAAGAGA